MSPSFNFQYPYHCRPGFGSGKLLIEFIASVERDSFQSDLLNALGVLKPVLAAESDRWMNDGIVHRISSDLGECTLSRDNWGLAFITSDVNQDLIRAIDGILSKDHRFAKVEVDHERFCATPDQTELQSRESGFLSSFGSNRRRAGRIEWVR